jgi:hypothetical protein
LVATDPNEDGGHLGPVVGIAATEHKCGCGIVYAKVHTAVMEVEDTKPNEGQDES